MLPVSLHASSGAILQITLRDFNGSLLKIGVCLEPVALLLDGLSAPIE